MLPETALVTLALGWLGAIAVPIFSGFGPEAVATRLQDSEAAFLVTADAFPRRGQLVRLKEIADRALAHCPTVRRVLVVRRSGTDIPWVSNRDHWWHERLAAVSIGPAATLTDATSPYMLIYTSGTTGRPKGTVHVQAGFPIKAAHDLAYCFDVQTDDRVLWLTDLGWMMGPWLIQGTLLLGATAVLYEGTPDWPTADRLWQLVARHRITVLGLTPTVVRALMARNAAPQERHDLSSLRAFGSTGEPWNPTPWWWLFETVGARRRPIINYSGGTEIGGGIVGCTTIEPQAPCAFTGPVPGMAADVVDEAGRSVRGRVGELVIRQPWVGMTAGFWRDPDRYLATYWSRWPHLWVHGDWALVDDSGFWYILGRSDDTLKIAGKRLGPAEVESVAVAHPAVQEAAAIGIPDPVKGEALVVFCILRRGTEPSDELAQ
ncbi:MAG: AMP-binding protein, partial [Thermomicrobium sp.]